MQKINEGTVIECDGIQCCIIHEGYKVFLTLIC